MILLFLCCLWGFFCTTSRRIPGGISENIWRRLWRRCAGGLLYREAVCGRRSILPQQKDWGEPCGLVCSHRDLRGGAPLSDGSCASVNVRGHGICRSARTVCGSVPVPGEAVSDSAHAGVWILILLLRCAVCTKSTRQTLSLPPEKRRNR